MSSKVKNSYWKILLLSMIASFITASTIVLSTEGDFNIIKLFLPMVFEFMSIAALAHGFVFSFLAYWCLKNKDLDVLIYILYLAIVIFIVVLTLLGILTGIIIPLVYIYWIVILLVVKYFWPDNYQIP